MVKRELFELKALGAVLATKLISQVDIQSGEFNVALGFVFGVQAEDFGEGEVLIHGADGFIFVFNHHLGPPGEQ